MPKIHNLAIIFLVLGVIMAEFLPNLNPAANSTAYSQNIITPNQSELLLSFLESQGQDLINRSNQIDTASIENLANTPTNLNILAEDIARGLAASNYVDISLTTPSSPASINHYLPENNQFIPVPNIPETDKPFIKDIIPPANTPLSEAYAQGGKAWYEKENKVIVQLLPDENNLKSYDKTTGEEIDWLQDRLNYEPLNSPDALINYLTNYHGEIVAETSSWAFVGFPSGGYIKIAKSSSSGYGPFLTQE